MEIRKWKFENEKPSWQDCFCLPRGQQKKTETENQELITANRELLGANGENVFAANADFDA